MIVPCDNEIERVFELVNNWISQDEPIPPSKHLKILKWLQATEEYLENEK